MYARLSITFWCFNLKPVFFINLLLNSSLLLRGKRKFFLCTSGAKDSTKRKAFVSVVIKGSMAGFGMVCRKRHRDDIQGDPGKND